MAGDVVFVYNAEKSKLLREKRGLGFEEMVEYIEDGKTVSTRLHPNQKKHPGQWQYEVDVEGYMYVVPFYPHGNIRDLKTLYPSRKANKKHKGISL
jgi:hypothetical protein